MSRKFLTSNILSSVWEMVANFHTVLYLRSESQFTLLEMTNSHCSISIHNRNIIPYFRNTKRHKRYNLAYGANLMRAIPLCYINLMV
jgi:hypothetical protein